MDIRLSSTEAQVIVNQFNLLVWMKMTTGVIKMQNQENTQKGAVARKIAMSLWTVSWADEIVGNWPLHEDGWKKP